MMLYGLKLITPPATEPLALDAVKRQLGIDHDDEDDDLLDAIGSVRSSIETDLGRALVTQTWDVTWDCWPWGYWLEVPLPPLQSVTSLTWTDLAGVPHVLTATTDYVVDTTREPARIVPAAGKTWPSSALAPVNGITARIVCGYGEATTVPGNIRMAMLLRLGAWYFGRAGREQPPGGATADVTAAVAALLAPLRRPQHA